MSNELKQLKKELLGANSDVRKTELKGQIEALKLVADSAINRHQREVNYDTKEFTIEITVNKYSEGLDEDKNELFVPDYQRDFVWSKRNQSRLIESILIGLPIPYIFIADVKSEDPELDGRVEIVDGSQRIRTLHAFIKGQLILDELQLIPELNGFTFLDLPASRQRRFNRTSVRIIELSGCTEATRRDLFERINTGGSELKDMEVRKGSEHGDSVLFKKVIEVCADNSIFKELVPISEHKLKRGEDLEFVLRFFAYVSNYRNFDHSVRDFLNDYLGQNSDLDEDECGRLVDLFCKTMEFAKTYFPFGFSKTPGAKSTPRVRFEALAVGIALAISQSPDLEPTNISDWLFSEDFKRLTTGDASNSRPRVIERIEFVTKKLMEGS